MIYRTVHKDTNTGHLLPRVRWHQWTVVRLAGIAMITVLAGYLTAAFLAVKSIDQLLHIVHDENIEQSLRIGLDSMKDAYKTRQEFLLEQMKYRMTEPERATRARIEQVLNEVHASELMKQDGWSVRAIEEPGDLEIHWINRQDLKIGRFVVQFPGKAQADEYRRVEEILQRYEVIGLELRERIRPALLKALSITLAIMCGLLLLAFIYMAVRSKTRIQKLVQGFIYYAEGDEAFRFTHHGQNELGLLSRQFNFMADDIGDNRVRAINLEKLASWQTIARKMAHEIKNPLTPIKIMIGQLKRHYDGSDAEYQALLEKAHSVILEEVSSLRRMVDDFSQFAQLPSPRFAMCNVVDCVKQTVALAEGSYAPHTIQWELTRDNIAAELDEQLIRQALHNLIKNAAEADPNSASPIVLRLQENATHVIFEIEDHGPGIPDQLRQSIFEAYVTTKHTGPNPGMGLGLAICQKIVLEHAGKISLESAPGRTIFRIALPKHRKGARL